MMRIGVPRAFSFFRFHTAWKTFFEKLGAEVVVSSPTTRATLEMGLTYALPETCLPLKLFFGHVRSLVGQVDALLVPSILRLAPGATNCANIIGLPDMLQSMMPDLPPMIAPDVDLSGGDRAIWQMVLREGSRFSYNPLSLWEATQTAWAVYQNDRVAMQEGILTPAGFDQAERQVPASITDKLPVCVIGHPYTLYDPFINHNLLKRLERLGVSVLTPERLGPMPTSDYWTFEYELVGAARLALARGDVAGCISVAAFGCGSDGVMLEEVAKQCRKSGVPLMNITLDEHSGEAGLVTRLEAFVDMLNWRKAANG